MMRGRGRTRGMMNDRYEGIDIMVVGGSGKRDQGIGEKNRVVGLW